MAIVVSTGPREYDARKRDLKLPQTGLKYADLGATELPTSPHEKYTHRHGQATRTFRLTSWPGRWDFAAYVLGWCEPRFAGDGTFSHLRRILPDAYLPTVNVVPVQRYHHRLDVDDHGRTVEAGSVEAEEQERPWLWATDVVSVKGVGPQKTTFLPGLDPGLAAFSTYPEARVEVSYEVRHYRLVLDEEMVEKGMRRIDADGKLVPDESHASRYCSFHPQPVTLHASVPQDGMRWASTAPAGLAGEVARAETPYIKRSVDCQLRWYGVPGLPAGLHDLLGTVNDRAFEVRPPGQHHKFSAHTLMYLGFRLHTYRQVTGGYAHDVALLFSHFPDGHNRELAFPPGGAYRYATLTTAGYSPASDDYLKKMLYAEADFRKLFTLPPIS